MSDCGRDRRRAAVRTLGGDVVAVVPDLATGTAFSFHFKDDVVVHIRQA